MPKITKKEKESTRTVVAKTKTDKGNNSPEAFKWWKAQSKTELANQLLSTALFLKEQQSYRYRQAAIYARLYGNMPLYNFAGANINKQNLANNLPMDRPTMNVIQSCIDTLVSRLTQSKPRPVFLTEAGDYKERNRAKQLNQFIMGEFYRNKAHQMGEIALRDASVLGDGFIKVLEKDKKVAFNRVIETELLFDHNDALYGDPRQMYQLALVDREVAIDAMPEAKSIIKQAQQAYPDGSADAQKTASDQIMVIEGWRLPSSKDAKDGRHSLVCSEGVIFDEDYDKPRFPFSQLQSSPRMLGPFGQGTCERLMGTQVEINKLLITMSTAINLVGVPRVFLEKGSKVAKAHINNMVGAIVEYSGTMPSYQVAPCIPAEMYEQLQRLITYAYQQEGISQLAASSQKPAGLNSGEAIRNYDDLQSDRFASLSKRYDNFYIDLAYLTTDLARDISIRDGKYATIYPNKDGTKEIDLPKFKLTEDPVIQCFDSSSLPREPAGRMAKITEYMQAGILSIREGRRLMDFPDLEQVERLANASEERILKYLDEIVEDGKYTGPDPFMDLELATQLVTQYYNLYVGAKLEEKRAQQLRDFFSQVNDLKAQAAQAMAPPPGMMPPGAPPAPGADATIGVPQQQPTSDLLPVA